MEACGHFVNILGYIVGFCHNLYLPWEHFASRYLRERMYYSKVLFLGALNFYLF